MVTRRTRPYASSADPETLVQLMRDPSFLRECCRSAGENHVELEVEDLSDCHRVRVSRTTEVELPSFVGKLFSPRNRVIDTTCWRRLNDRWLGEYAVIIAGISSAGSIDGSLTIAPSGRGSTLVSTFEVRVHLPLVGQSFETFVANRVEESLHVRCAALQAAQPSHLAEIRA
jgi:hypothetical protein